MLLVWEILGKSEAWAKIGGVYEKATGNDLGGPTVWVGQGLWKSAGWGEQYELCWWRLRYGVHLLLLCWEGSAREQWPLPALLGESYPSSPHTEARQFSSSLLCTHMKLFFKDFIYLFLERGGGKEKKREKTSMCDCLLHAPSWGPGLQPRHVLWVGIKLATLVRKLTLSPLNHTIQGPIWNFLSVASRLELRASEIISKFMHRPFKRNTWDTRSPQPHSATIFAFYSQKLWGVLFPAVEPYSGGIHNVGLGHLTSQDVTKWVVSTNCWRRQGGRKKKTPRWNWRLKAAYTPEGDSPRQTSSSRDSAEGNLYRVCMVQDFAPLLINM